MNKILYSVWFSINTVLLLVTIYLNFITDENKHSGKIVALIFFISIFAFLFIISNLKYRKKVKDENK